MYFVMSIGFDIQTHEHVELRRPTCFVISYVDFLMVFYLLILPEFSFRGLDSYSLMLVHDLDIALVNCDG